MPERICNVAMTSPNWNNECKRTTVLISRTACTTEFLPWLKKRATMAATDQWLCKAGKLRPPEKEGWERMHDFEAMSS